MNALLLVALGLARGATAASGDGDQCCIAKEFHTTVEEKGGGRAEPEASRVYAERFPCKGVERIRRVEGRREVTTEYPWAEARVAAKSDGNTCAGLKKVVKKSQCLMDQCLHHFTKSGYKRNAWRHIRDLAANEPYFHKGKSHQAEYELLMAQDFVQSDYLKYSCALEVDSHECMVRTCLKLKKFFGMLSNEEEGTLKGKEPEVVSNHDTVGRVISKEKDKECPATHELSGYKENTCISMEVTKHPLWNTFGTTCAAPKAKAGATYEYQSEGTKKGTGAKYEYENVKATAKKLSSTGQDNAVRTVRVRKLLRRLLRGMVASE